jgi:hypothetical protein
MHLHATAPVHARFFCYPFGNPALPCSRPPPACATTQCGTIKHFIVILPPSGPRA